MSNFCPNCGEKLETVSKFCPNCGKEIINSEIEQSEYKIQKSSEKSFWRKFFSKKGRLNRLRYLQYRLAILGIFIICGIILGTLGVVFSGISVSSINIIIPLIVIIAIIMLFAGAVSGITLIIRRLHDLNFSGWWCLGYLFITFWANLFTKFPDKDEFLVWHILAIVLWIMLLAFELALFFMKGTVGNNKYGADPLEK